MFQYFHDVNAYVEEDQRYGTDSVKLELDEDTLEVKCFVVDVYEQPIEGRDNLAYKQFDDFKMALDYYRHLAHQLAQGDVIRHV